jgi:8-oxo-dGTP pyrophosphatase MutT (NUDIX family)
LVGAVEAAVVLVVDGGRVLLLKTAAGHVGEGKWKGLSGKLLSGESPSEGATREAFEESGLRVSDLVRHGVVRCCFGGRENPDWIVHVFSTDSFEGDMRHGPEGAPRWIPLEEIPYGEMWEDNMHWLPLVLEGKRFKGTFQYDEEGSKLLDFSLDVEDLRA